MIHRPVAHYIQRDILRQLARTANNERSFGELKPSGIENNLFSYHLKQLVNDGLVIWRQNQYRLSADGVRYVGAVSRTNLDMLPQPKLFCLLLLQNDAGEFALHRRHAQPFVGSYTFPGGIVFFGETAQEVVNRQLNEKIGCIIPTIDRGMASLRLGDQHEVLSHSYAHLFYGRVKGRPPLKAKDDRFAPEWIQVYDTPDDELMPDVKAILAKLTGNQSYFFLDFANTYE